MVCVCECIRRIGCVLYTVSCVGRVPYRALVCSSYYTPSMVYGIYCTRPEGKCSKYAIRYQSRVVSDLPKISAGNLNFSASCRGAALELVVISL